MKTFYFPFLLYLILSCSSASKSETSDPKEARVAQEVEQSASTKPYATLKAETLAKRAEFKKKYDAAQGNSEKQSKILTEAQTYLIDISDDYFRSWYGTPWDFNGHTTVPREGKIACGYLVTTILRDMDFDIPRIKWAQQASAYIVKQVSTNIKQFSNQSMDVVIKHIEKEGEGVYIVGLDSHVGFIYYTKQKMSFVHANYYKPEQGVMSEKLIGWNPLDHSKYRIVGKIFEKEMVRNWVLNNAYPFIPPK